LKIVLNKKSSGPTCQSQAPLQRRPDASITRTRQLRGFCRYLAPMLPTGHHIRSTQDACSRRPVRHLSRCRYVGDAVSPLPATATKRCHSTLLSLHSSAPSLPHSFAPSTEAPTTPHRHRVPLRHAKPAAEPPSAASSRRRPEPATSFS
jgi:hypothetical protein